MISGIIKYEFKRRFGHWTIVLICLALIFQGIWYTKGTFDYYVNEDLLMNAPAIFYKNLAGGGILMIIIIAIITGTVLYKDIEHKTSQWIYTLPMKEKQFFLGRFFSAYFINVLVAFSYVIGMLLVPYAGIGESHRFGPAPVLQLIQGFVLILMPNLLLLTSLIFFLIISFKRMAAGYLGVFVTTVFFLVMQTVSETSGATPFIQMADPFGFVATDTLVNSLSSLEKNTGFLPIEGIWIFNRLFWLSVSFLLIAVAYRQFSFKYFIETKDRKKTHQDQHADRPASVSAESLEFQPQFSAILYIKKLWTLAILEFNNVTRPTSFKIILGIILLMATLQNLLWNASYYIGNTVPLTSGMTLFRLSFGVFIMILIMVWSGELFFKDKTVKIWQITDALPVPVWVTQLSKFIAMSGVAFILAASFMIIGVLVQILKGGVDQIDWSLYAYDLLGFNWGWLTYVLQIALVFFFTGLTGNRFFTHIISVGIFFMIIMAFELGLAEQVIYAYAAVPGLEDYSEMSGYGIWVISAPWYFLMWTLLAITMVLLGVLFWNRGVGQKWSQKLLFTGKQLNWAGKAAALLFFIAFVAVRYHINQQVTGEGNFVLSAVEEADAAAYERTYAFLKETEQPKYRKLDLLFDFHPEIRKADYQAEFQLISSDSSGVKELYLNFPAFVAIEELKMQDGKSLVKKRHDERHDLYIYDIPKSAINDTLNLVLKASKQYQGFTQSGDNPQADLTFKGSFGSIRDFLPVIGYCDDKELVENRKREDHGLSKLNSRMSAVNDSQALQQLSQTPDALKVYGSVQISTTANQLPLAPGKLEKAWDNEGRNYALYRIDEPAVFDWHLGSFETNPIENTKGDFSYAIWHSPKHPFNIKLYEKAIVQSLDFIQSKLGDFPIDELRVVEIPYYHDKFFAFPNTIAISEKEGWYADTTGLTERAYVHHTIASQMIKIWLESNTEVANVQGADMIQLALPEALAMHYVDQTIGEEATKLLIDKKSDLYNKDRYNEPNKEPVLLYADGADYLEENKGAIAIFQLLESIGSDQFIEVLKNWVQSADEPKVFKTFYHQSLASLSPTDHRDMKKIFEE
ncbi:MAG: ABC transporter permease [Bacteroidota bacterium]